jgi:hypothetical protein
MDGAHRLLLPTGLHACHLAAGLLVAADLAHICICRSRPNCSQACAHYTHACAQTPQVSGHSGDIRWMKSALAMQI